MLSPQLQVGKVSRGMTLLEDIEEKEKREDSKLSEKKLFSKEQAERHNSSTGSLPKIKVKEDKSVAKASSKALHNCDRPQFMEQIMQRVDEKLNEFENKIMANAKMVSATHL